MNFPLDQRERAQARWAIYATVGLTGLSALWLFHPGFCWDQVPAFRDGFHFYYPQAVWLEQQRQQGVWFPAWNHNESLGVSVAGQPSSALFYPLRGLWWLPGLSIEQRYAVFLAVHVMLAGAGAAWAASRAGAGRSAALAGVSYALSAPALFQHTNLIYLCSAAWLGWTVGILIDVWVGRPAGLKRAAGMAAGLGMMVLAGDAHTAVNMWIIVAGCLMVLAIGRCWATTRRGHSTSTGDAIRTNLHQVARHAVWLATVTGLAAAITYPQWRTTIAWMQTAGQWTDLSNPSTAIRPAGASSGRTPAARLIEEIVDGTPDAPRGTFQFSLSPWHALTLVWPTLGGHYLPEHSRWWAGLPAESRMWLPSLYSGTFPALLLVGVLSRRRGQHAGTYSGRLAAVAGWLIALACVAGILALGNYTALWLVKQGLLGLQLEAAAEQLPPDWWASPYWWLMQLVPGYDLFRYPAKWCSVMAITMAVAAACRLQLVALTPNERDEHQPFLFWRREGLGWIGLGSLLVLAIAAVGFFANDGQWFPAWKDPWFGAPQAHAVATTLAVAAGWPWVAMAIVAGLRRRLQCLRTAVVLGTWLEMTVVAGAWVHFAPAVGQFPSTQSASIASHLRGRSASDTQETAGAAVHPWSTIWCDPTEANFAEDVPDASELSDLVQPQADYQARLRLGKLALLFHEHNLAAIQSLPDARMQRVKHWLMRHDSMDVQQPQLDRVLCELGVEVRLARRRHPEGFPELTWVRIRQPAPLCQVYSRLDPTQLVSGAEVAWQWSDCQTLHVTVDTPVDALLLVRQLNTGRIRIDSLDPQTYHTASSFVCPAGPFFVEQMVPAGKCRLVFRFR